jgi:hypothetical protein
MTRMSQSGIRVDWIDPGLSGAQATNCEFSAAFAGPARRVTSFG